MAKPFDEFVAHIREKDREEQSVIEHSRAVAQRAAEKGKDYDLADIMYCAGLHHDDGKFMPAFKDYIQKAARGEPVQRGSVPHAVHGAVLIDSLFPIQDKYQKSTVEWLRYIILSHHGLRDAVETEGKVPFEESKKAIEHDFERLKELAEKYYGRDELTKEYEKAVLNGKKLFKKINTFKNTYQTAKIHRLFLTGMYARLMLSLLIDADHSDTADFEEERTSVKRPNRAQRKEEWRKRQAFFETKLANIGRDKTPSTLDCYRQEISNACFTFPTAESGMYRMVVPCGAGKTLSSLRYALRVAKDYGKKHIFYIAPFNSILEQNADELRKFLGGAEIVLEHHSNVVFEPDSEKEKEYLLLTENWEESPVIATTAVQFLNTLFGGKKSSIRRMQALGDSVIILDEVQALPLKVTKLFNGAMNFLSYFCHSNIILCSATQPPLEDLDNYRLIEPLNIIEKEEEYARVFKRVEIVPYLEESKFTYEETADYIERQAEEVKSLLLVVNTKECASEVFSFLKKKYPEDSPYVLFHLSTNMYPLHRKLKISEIREMLINKNKKVICVSTSLIEAGVDVSFERVVRSLTGLDSIVQAAGRCNRNKETDCGKVIVIDIKEEKFGRGSSVKQIQDFTRSVFYDIENYPKEFVGGALSKRAMDVYYRYYYNKFKTGLGYPLGKNNPYSLVDLLSTNTRIVKENIREKFFLPQAFKEAANHFKVIDDEAKFSVVVVANGQVADKIKELRKKKFPSEKRKILRELQPYTVQINKYQIKNYEDNIETNEILTMDKKYYSDDIGLDETKDALAEFLNA